MACGKHVPVLPGTGGSDVKVTYRIILTVGLAVFVCGSIPIAQSQTASTQSTTAPLHMMVQPGGGVRCRVAIRGAKQGPFKGDSTARGQEKWIHCSQFLLSLTSPRDAATGMATGKRQYAPIVITKEWDAASPQIFQAAATNEVLPQVELEFLRTGPQGIESVFETVTLTNATISAVKQYIGFPDAGEPPNPHPLENVSFTFQKIEITNAEGKTMAVDDWSSR
jgi:type VI secretion system secreted protein Hcp